MFSKAKRFEDKPVGCGADANYEPKDRNKPIGGVIPKVDRFVETRCVNSDNESINSEKSCQVFRTPKSVRRIASKFDELQELKKQYELQIKNDEEKYCLELELIKESGYEKIRLCEIEFEERHNKLKSLTESQINEERKKYQELKTHQETTEKEIMECKSKIDELNIILHNRNEELSELLNAVSDFKSNNDSKENLLEQLQSKINATEEALIEQKCSYETKIEELKTRVDAAIREKNIFSITLDATKESANVLSTRLRNSDRDVEKFKNEYEKASVLNNMYESEIVELQIELSNFKDEYTELLTSIVNSKALLDKNHNEILANNSVLMEKLEQTKTALIDDIQALKTDIFNDLDEFKLKAQNSINEYQHKIENEHKLFTNIKTECDNAYIKINDCQHLLSVAETQLEMKDQEINEAMTENDKLSGTLAALEQEKRELQVLLTEFTKLAEDKDQKLYENLKKIEKQEKEMLEHINHCEELSQYLEAAEFIVKENDGEIEHLNVKIQQLTLDKENLEGSRAELILESKTLKLKMKKCETELKRVQNDLDSTIDEKGNMFSILSEKNIELENANEKFVHLEKQLKGLESHLLTCKEDELQKHCEYLNKEYDSLYTKYANLLSHQNNKQKIKHMLDLKNQNGALKEENEKLVFESLKQRTLIEKLKKDLAESVSQKSPSVHRRHLQTPHDKENRSTLSPNVLSKPSSQRSLTPLRDLNH